MASASEPVPCTTLSIDTLAFEFEPLLVEREVVCLHAPASSNVSLPGLPRANGWKVRASS